MAFIVPTIVVREAEFRPPRVYDKVFLLLVSSLLKVQGTGPLPGCPRAASCSAVH